MDIAKSTNGMRLTHTPWGTPDEQREIADGVYVVTTPSHGGIWLTDSKRLEMPPQYRDIPTFAGGNWYEEDCDWCLVALSFPALFEPEELEAARECFDWMQEQNIINERKERAA